MPGHYGHGKKKPKKPMKTMMVKKKGSKKK